MISIKYLVVSAIGLQYASFDVFRYYSSICSLSVTFIVKWYCVSTKLISEAIEKIMWFLYFSLFLWWILLVNFSRLNHTHITSRVSLGMMNAFYVIFEFSLTVFYWKKFHWCLLCNFHLYISFIYYIIFFSVWISGQWFFSQNQCGNLPPICTHGKIEIVLF